MEPQKPNIVLEGLPKWHDPPEIDPPLPPPSSEIPPPASAPEPPEQIEVDVPKNLPSKETQLEHPKRVGVWRSGGPQGMDNEPAEIIGEETHDDGSKYYLMKPPEGKPYYAPADEVVEGSGISPQSLSEVSQASIEMTEIESPTLAKLQHEQLEANTKSSQLENLLESGKAKVREAIDANDFQKAANYTHESAERLWRLQDAQKLTDDVEKRVKFAKEALNPANLLDLKEKFEHQLQKQTSLRERSPNVASGLEPLNDYAAMLKSHLIAEYLKTGLKDGESRDLPSELADEIFDLLDKSFAELESIATSAKPKENENQTPAIDIDAVQPIPDDEKQFGNESELREVKYVHNGVNQNGWKVVGYGLRPTTGKIEVHIKSPDGRTDAWVEQEALLGMQPENQPAETPPTEPEPEPNPHSEPAIVPEPDPQPPPEGHRTPPLPPELGPNPLVPEPELANEPPVSSLDLHPTRLEFRTRLGRLAGRAFKFGVYVVKWRLGLHESIPMTQFRPPERPPEQTPENSDTINP